jgi:hypothetical protein
MESYQDAMFELRESNRVRANPNTKVPPTGLTMTGQSLAATCLRLIGFFCPSPLARFQCQEHQHGFKKGVFLGKSWSDTLWRVSATRDVACRMSYFLCLSKPGDASAAARTSRTGSPRTASHQIWTLESVNCLPHEEFATHGSLQKDAEAFACLKDETMLLSSFKNRKLPLKKDRTYYR